MDWRAIIDFFYADNAEARDVLMEHSRAVAHMAAEINRKRELGLNPAEVEAAAMLHDIGMVRTHAPGIGCHGEMPYICHGVIGADMLRTVGAPEWTARVAERHTGAGLTPEDIATQQLPLPTDRVMMPETTLERLVCYADKFFSKRPGHLSTPKTLEQVRCEMARHGEASLRRFDTLHHDFTVP